MKDISNQLVQLTKDVSIATRIEDKRQVYSAWLVFSVMLAIPTVVGFIWPDYFMKVAGITAVIAGLSVAIIACSLEGLIFGLAIGLPVIYGGDTLANIYGQDFVLIETLTLVYITLIVAILALLPYLTTMIIYAFWSITKRNITGVAYLNGLSWSVYGDVNKFQKSILSDEITNYLDERRKQSSYLYVFELERLKLINKQSSTIMAKKCKDWEPRPREKKCMNCKLNSICPFQPGSALEHIGDGHL